MAYNETAIYCDSAQYANVAAWAATHAYTVGNIVRQLATPTVNNERCFVCVVAGTSLSSEPAWVLTRGASTAEAGGPTWRECTGQPGTNGDATNTNVWKSSQGTVTLGTVIQNTARTAYFVCTTSSTGGTGAEPSWNTTLGATTTDGSAVWTCIKSAGNFSSWAAPCARVRLPLNLASTWLVNAGMTIYVGDDHAETDATLTPTVGPVSNCQILCIDHTVAMPAGSANLKTTASITMSGTTVNMIGGSGIGSVYAYGIQFIYDATSAFNFATGANRHRFEQCSIIFTHNNLVCGVGDSLVGTVVEFKDCTFTFANSGAGYAIFIPRGPVKLENPTFSGVLTASGSSALFCNTTGTSSALTSLIVEGADFTPMPSNMFLVNTVARGNFLFKDCKLPSGFAGVAAGGDAGIVEQGTIDLVRCDSGGTAYRNERHMRNGTQTTSTSVVRTGGAQDGATAISHQIVPTTNALFPYQRFDALPYSIFNTVTGTNRNVTIYGIANDSRVPNNSEVWFDAEYLGSASTPQGSYVRGGMTVLGTASALSTDTSAWDSAATARANTHAYNVGDVIKTASNPGRVFFCTVAGTSAGSEPGGYATAVDGGSVTDGGATFRAGCRFSQTVTLSSPQPAQQGYLMAYPRFARASTTYFIDPLIALS